MTMLLVILVIVILSSASAEHRQTSFRSNPPSASEENRTSTTPLFYTSPIASTSHISQTFKDRTPPDGPGATTTSEDPQKQPDAALNQLNGNDRSKRASGAAPPNQERSDLWTKSEKQDGGVGESDGYYYGHSKPGSTSMDVFSGRNGSPVSVGSSLYNLPEDFLRNAAMRLEAAAERADKRGGGAVSGFLGMRGKKGNDGERPDEGVKRSRLQNGFVGMRGKKNPATGAFYGMRGKKDADGEQYEDAIDDGSDVNDKRVASNAFFGMRGKKPMTSSAAEDVVGQEEEDDEGWQSDSEMIKRKPTNAFLGMRGKKGDDEAASSKRQISNAFLGMRGKKDGGDDNDSLDEEKRGGSGTKGFIGMRGKRGRLSSGPMTIKYGGARSNLQSEGHHPHIRDVRELYRTFMESSAIDRPRTYADRKRQIGNIFIGMRG